MIKTSTMSVNDDSNIDSVAASNRNSDNKLSTKRRFGTGEVDTHTTKGRTISKSMFSADPAERLEKFSAIVISGHYFLLEFRLIKPPIYGNISA